MIPLDGRISSPGLARANIFVMKRLLGDFAMRLTAVVIILVQGHLDDVLSRYDGAWTRGASSRPATVLRRLLDPR